MSIDKNPTWGELWSVLAHHQKPWTPEHALNRLFGEHFPGASLPYLGPDTATVSKAYWSTEDLDAVERPDRTTTGPARLDVSVVVVKWKGRFYHVDGRRRVNHWVANGDKERHATLVVEPRSR